MEVLLREDGPKLLPNPPALGKAARQIRRLLTRLVIKLFVEKSRKRIVNTNVIGFQIKVLPGIFHPRYYFSSRFFAKVLSEQIAFSGKRVLDIGCGTGILSLVAGRAGASVVAVDINPDAVKCTKMNADANNLAHRVEVLESNLFDQVKSSESFDYIITNPPFYEGEPASREEYAWKGGADRRFLRTIAREAPKFLRAGGCILCVLSSDADVDAQLRVFVEAGYTWSLLASKRFPFERMYVVKLSPAGDNESHEA